MFRIQSERLYGEMRKMLAEGCISFSATRVSTDVGSDSDSSKICLHGRPLWHYQQELEAALRESGPLYVFDLLHLVPIKLEAGIGDSYTWNRSQVYLLGDRNNVPERTDQLVQLVKACPEGPVLERVQNDLEQRFKSDEVPRKWFQQFLTDVRREKRKVLQITYGPVFYDKNDLTNFTELFLGGRTIESHICDDDGD